MEKKIICIFTMIIFINLIYYKTYAQNTSFASIIGYAVEVENYNSAGGENENIDIEEDEGYYLENANEEEDNSTDETDETTPIKDILVELLNSNNEIIATTRTDENGKYTFNNVENGVYRIQYTWGKVDENEINNANLENDGENIKKIQNILKYNGQDYWIDNENQNLVTENNELRKEINSKFKSFSYENTAMFNAIDMDVLSDSDLSNFKKYALDLSKYYMNGKSTQEITINNSSRNGQSINGPTLKLMQRDVYTIEPSVNLLEMSVTLNNGSVISNTATDEYEPNDLVLSIDEKNIYGSNLKLKYSISFDNVYSSSSTSKFAFLLYLPNKFDYNDSYGIQATGISKDNESTNLNVEKVIAFNSDNVNDLKGVSEDVSNYVKNNTAIYVSIDLKNQNFSLSSGESLKIILSVGSLLSKQDNLLYNGKVEIVGYENDSNRRLQYLQTDQFDTDAVAGNINEDESDYIESSNWASIIPPTGKNKNFQIAILSFILLLIVLLAHFKPFNKLRIKRRL